MNARRGLLYAVLAATVAAAWWTASRESEQDGEVVEVARPGEPRAAPGAGQADGPAPAGARRATADRFQAKGPDLFPKQSWQPPPPPPPKYVPPPPPPPVAPPLPFTYVGRWQDGDGEVFFLGQGQQVHNLRQGDRVGQWRLDGVAPGSLTFTYLPMDKQQTMRFAQ
ncbi:MAG: hypothetical protein MUC79_11305 [Thiobacillaceae bacterium]|jgi:hypothetical protein|nr:hypothetical protein [Thiobacillaceae bacterium]